MFICLPHPIWLLHIFSIWLVGQLNHPIWSQRFFSRCSLPPPGSSTERQRRSWRCEAVKHLRGRCQAKRKEGKFWRNRNQQKLKVWVIKCCFWKVWDFNPFIFFCKGWCIYIYIYGFLFTVYIHGLVDLLGTCVGELVVILSTLILVGWRIHRRMRVFFHPRMRIQSSPPRWLQKFLVQPVGPEPIVTKIGL